MRSIKHSITYYNVILVQVNPCWVERELCGSTKKHGL